MSMDEIGRFRLYEIVDSPRGQPHLLDQSRPRGARRAVEVPAVDRFLGDFAWTLLGACQLQGLPTEPALLAQDGQGAERVPAVQWKRVVEHMKDTQVVHDAIASLRGGSGIAVPSPTSATRRRNASNISSVQRGAL